MFTYDEASELIDAPTNRNRKKGKVAVPVSSAGGRTRYLWLTREDGRIIGTLYGNAVAWWRDPMSEDRSGGPLLPGHVAVRTCGYYTPSTRDALAWVAGRMVSMHTPGSGGPSMASQSAPTNRTDWHCMVGDVKVGNDWVDLTRQATKV